LLLPYLLDHPPAHILLAAIIGFEPRSYRQAPFGRQAASGHRGAAELAAAVGPGFAVGPDLHAGLPRSATLDFDQLKKRTEAATIAQGNVPIPQALSVESK
jgi:hypothetical protein